MSLWCKFAWLVFATKNTDEVNCWLSPVRICICRFLCVFKFVYFGFAKNSIRINPVERIMSSLSQFGIRQSNCVGLRCWAVEKMPMHLHQLHLRQIAKPTHHTTLIAVPFFTVIFDASFVSFSPSFSYQFLFEMSLRGACISYYLIINVRCIKNTCFSCLLHK